MRPWFLMFLLCCFGHALARDGSLDRLVVLSYHDVREVRGDRLDPYSIEAAELVNQFAWLREHGYTPVSLQQVIAAHGGGSPLPAKPVLLTFDDGYRSFYRLVYPLLQLFDYPAVLALVGSWLADPRSGQAAAPAHAPLLDWDEIRAMTQSGLVEIASHSQDLHRGVPANIEGNELPAATTRAFTAADPQYETDAQYEARVRADLARSAALIARETGRPPRAMVWPYGAYNGSVERIARELGMTVSVSLDQHSRFAGPGMHLGRVLIQGNPGLTAFAAELLRPYPPTLIRGAHVDLDAVYDPDPLRQEEKLSRLIDRVAALGLNTLFLRAFHDTDGDGRADAVYFPTPQMPVRANLLGRAAWQLHTRAQVQVYAWLPVPGTGAMLATLDAGERRRVTALFEDLGRHAPVDGLLFRDDLAAGEDTAYETLVQEILAAVARRRAPIATARSLPLRSAVSEDDAKQPASALLTARQRYGMVLLRAAPASAEQQAWLGRFARSLPPADAMLGTVVFDITSNHDRLPAILQALQLQGAGNLSYGPDEFWRNSPPLATLRPAFSAQSEAR